MIPAYSPQARGRSERSFGTWQGRLPQELRLAGCTTLEQANRFLRERYIAEFNRRFRVAAAERGSAFVRCSASDLQRVFSLQFERTVNRDNTVSFRQSHAADSAGALARHAGRLQRHRTPTSGWHSRVSATDRTAWVATTQAGLPLSGKASTEMSRERGQTPLTSPQPHRQYPLDCQSARAKP